MRNLQRAIFSSVVASLVVSIGACGGGGSGAGGGVPSIATSKFLDSAVQGLTFRTTSGLTGTTGADGSFQHVPNELVTFSVGGANLGTTGGGFGAILTPAELDTYADFTRAPTLNRVRFLMMLDSDRNPNNGITISGAVRTVAANWPAINFDTVNLDADPAVTSILSDVATADGQPASLPTTTNAQNHIFATYTCIRSGLYLGSWSSTSPAGMGGNNAMIVDRLGHITLVFTDSTWHSIAWVSSNTSISSPNSAIFSGSPVSTSAALNQTYDGTFRLTNSTNYLSGLPSMGNGNYSNTSVVVNLPNGTVGMVYQGTALGNSSLIAFKMAINGTSITGVATGANMPALSLSGTASGGLLNGTIYYDGSAVGSFSAAIQSDGSIAGSFTAGTDSGALSACRSP